MRFGNTSWMRINVDARGSSYKRKESNHMIVTFTERGDERSVTNDEIRALNYRRRRGSSNGGVPEIVDDLSIDEARHTYGINLLSIGTVDNCMKKKKR